MYIYGLVLKVRGGRQEHQNWTLSNLPLSYKEQHVPVVIRK